MYIALLLSVISVNAFGFVSSFGLSPYCQANMCPSYTQCVGGYCVPAPKPPVHKSLQTFQNCDVTNPFAKDKYCLRNHCSIPF